MSNQTEATFDSRRDDYPNVTVECPNGYLDRLYYLLGALDAIHPAEAVVKLHDHKGVLHVHSTTPLPFRMKMTIKRIWQSVRECPENVEWINAATGEGWSE